MNRPRVDDESSYMNAPLSSLPATNRLTDINGLRNSGIFAPGRVPSIRTLREWTTLRRIPHHRLGHFVYYDPSEVEAHIRTKLKVPAR